MPKLGLKCFIGSFLLSLVAVFAATKTYVILSMDEKQQIRSLTTEATPSHNIELYAVNEEPDPLYEKFNRLNTKSDDNMGGLQNNEIQTDETDEIKISASKEFDGDNILYKEEDDDGADLYIAASEPEVSDTDEFKIADAGELDKALEAEEKEDDLQIADASASPAFSIPLVHHFKTAAGNVTVSDKADSSQIALASHDVTIDNLGVENKAAVTEEIIGGIGDTTAEVNPKEDDNPWEVAEAANKHATKNILSATSAEHSSKVSAMDKDVTNVAQNEEVPYKMQKNLLVPIPDDIMNATDMTPQLSTSAENKKIEADLRARNELPTPKTGEPAPQVSADKEVPNLVPVKQETENKVSDDETSRSLTESIAAWFSGSENKSKSTPPAKEEKKPESQSNRDQSNSIFQKLLGIGSDNVTPTELKLAFQPNRAEISGQTLEWLHAFSDNAVKYENVLVEIRISKTAPYELQQKRLKLLYRILANNGVEYDKVNIIFTDREPNSFIIRNVRYATEEEQQKALAAKAYKPWY